MTMDNGSHIQVTDEWLYKHMPVVDEAITRLLESDVDHNHSFSGGFERKMRVLIGREKYGFFESIYLKRKSGSASLIGGVLAAASLCLALVFARAYHINAAPSYEKVLSEWGKYLSESDYTTEVYVQGENIRLTSSEVEQALVFYTLNGMTERAALKEAIVYMAEREALYQEALEAGYAATDEEVWEYLDGLKAIIASADNREDAQAIIDQFESEDAYWEYEFQVYKKNIPIQYYVSDLEKKFVAEYGSGEDWLKYFEEYKQGLVEAEKLQIVR